MFCCGSDFLDFFGNDAHTFLHTLFVPDCNFAHCSDTLLDEFRVNFIHVLFEFFQNQFVVFVVNDSRENLDLLVLYVVRVRKFREKTFYLVLKD